MIPWWASLAVAVISSVAVVTVAAVTNRATYRRELAARSTAARSDALQQLATAALGLRDAARAASGTARPSRSVTQAFDRAEAELVLRATATLDAGARAAAQMWRGKALPYFAGDPDVGRSEEEDAWRALLEGVGLALRESYRS